jgi:hypothetical protein
MSRALLLTPCARLGMRKTVLRALAFAGAMVAVSLAIDLLLAVFYQEIPLRDRGRQFFVFRTALHGATFVLTALGAAVGFAFLRSYSIANARILSLGAALGLFTLAAALTAVQAGGFWGITAWLIVGSALVSFFGGRVLGSREAHRED